MIRTKQLFISLLLVIALQSCQRHASLVIEPISEENNEALLTGKNLDLRLYSIKNTFQYYQIDGYSNLSAKKLAFKLDSFAKLRYPIKENKHRERLVIWFYKTQLYSNYSDLVYESARENENGSLTGHAEDIVALIDLEFLTKNKNILIRHTYIYYPKPGDTLAEHDTLSIK